MVGLVAPIYTSAWLPLQGELSPKVTEGAPDLKLLQAPTLLHVLPRRPHPLYEVLPPKGGSLGLHNPICANKKTPDFLQNQVFFMVEISGIEPLTS